MKNNLLRVLTYHRVAEPDKAPFLNPRLISAAPGVFAKQVKYLADNYNVVSMETVFDSVYYCRQLPKRAVLITFDDAYFDFKDVAWPILRDHGLPVTVFVPTNFPDQADRVFWWDKIYSSIVQTSEKNIRVSTLGNLLLDSDKERRWSLHKLQNHIKTLPHNQAMNFIDEVCAKLGNGANVEYCTLDWDELRGLVKEGVTLGAHTRNHPILTNISLEQVREEVRGSYQDLQREIGKVLPIFAYPNGNHNDKIKSILKDEGIKLAFTGLNGFNDMNSVDPLGIIRTNITRRTSPLIFRLRLLPWFGYIDRWRHRKRGS